MHAPMSTAEYYIRYGTFVPDLLTPPPTMAEAGPSFLGHHAHEPSLFRLHESDMTSHRAIAEHCVCIGTLMPDSLASLPTKAEACPSSRSTFMKVYLGDTYGGGCLLLERVQLSLVDCIWSGCL